MTDGDLILDTSVGSRGTYTVELARGYTVVARRTDTPGRASSIVQVLASGEGRIWKANAAPVSPRELNANLTDSLDGADRLDAMMDSPSHTTANIGEAIQDHPETQQKPGVADSD